MSGPKSETYIEYVRENHAGLRAFIRSLGVAPLWVDDIAQEAFIIAYDRLDEFDDRIAGHLLEDVGEGYEFRLEPLLLTQVPVAALC